MQQSNGDQALQGYRILDLSNEMGLYCTKLLADLGAEVIKVEPPEGNVVRRLPPFKDDVPNSETSLYFAYYNINKKSVTLNLHSADGQYLFKELVKTADAIVETSAPGEMESLGLGYEALKEVNPGIIVCSITGFGQTGPYKDYKAPDIVAFALGGIMYFGGPKEGPPLTGPIPLAYHATAMAAPQGILMALYHRLLTGQGQHIDVSMVECVGVASDWSLPTYTFTKLVKPRPGRACFPVPGGVYACKDGFIYIVIIPVDHWRALLDWMGNPEALLDPVWNNLDFRIENPDVVDLYVEEFTKQHAKAYLYEEAQKRRLPFTPVSLPSEIIDDDHMKARGYFIDVDHSVIGRHIYAGAPFLLTETPWRVTRPAPLLGEHNQEVFMQELGITEQELNALRANGVI